MRVGFDEAAETAELATRAVAADLAAEELVLSSAMLLPDALDVVRMHLGPDDMFSDKHRRIFAAICEVAERGEAVDMLSVRRRLDESGHLERIGGSSELMRLACHVEAVPNVEQHAQALRALSRVRALRALCQTLAAEALGDIDPAQWLPDVERRVLEAVATSDVGVRRPTVQEMLAAELKRLQDASTGAPAPSGGTEVRLSALRAIVPRWTDGDMHIVAGRPGMGKTGFAADECAWAARTRRSGEVCVGIFVSVEMTAERIVRRLLGRESGLGGATIEAGRIDPDRDWSPLVDGAHRLSSTPLSVIHMPGARVSQVRSAVRREFARLKRSHGATRIGLVVVDYLQLLKSEARRDADLNEQTTATSKALTAMAGELKCPVLALSQLNRAVEKRANKVPEISDLRDSGSLEQDAASITLLYRKAYYVADADPEGAEAIVAKHRHGKTGTAQLRWSGELTSYLDSSDYETARDVENVIGPHAFTDI